MIEKITMEGYELDADVDIVDSSPMSVIVAHGGNNDMNAYLMKRIYGAMKGKNSVMRFNFSFADGKFEREEERNKEELRACIRRMGSKNIVIIGKSWGGQMATKLASEKELGIIKVISLGYAIHSKDKPDNIKPQDHLKKARCPIEFIVGDSDPLCRISMFRKILPDCRLYVIDNANHSFLDPKTDKPNGGEDKAIATALGLI